jgi:hypothetical protein
MVDTVVSFTFCWVEKVLEYTNSPFKFRILTSFKGVDKFVVEIKIPDSPEN